MELGIGWEPLPPSGLLSTASVIKYPGNGALEEYSPEESWGVHVRVESFPSKFRLHVVQLPPSWIAHIMCRKSI